MALVAAVGVGAACSYDWSTAGDAGAQDGGHIDGPPVDGNASDAPVPDASAKDAADDMQVADSPPPNCTTLLANVVTARATAKQCTFPNPMVCTMTVIDECGCTQIVDRGKAQYESAVAAYKNAGCTNAVCTSCGTTNPGLCVVSDASTTGTACNQ